MNPERPACGTCPHYMMVTAGNDTEPVAFGECVVNPPTPLLILGVDGEPHSYAHRPVVGPDMPGCRFHPEMETWVAGAAGGIQVEPEVTRYTWCGLNFGPLSVLAVDEDLARLVAVAKLRGKLGTDEYGEADLEFDLLEVGRRKPTV